MRAVSGAQEEGGRMWTVCPLTPEKKAGRHSSASLGAASYREFGGRFSALAGLGS